VTGAPPGTPAEQLVAVRGELWQRHVLLQDMDRADARYDDASAELLGLTAELLRVEAEVTEVRRAARRRAGRIGFITAAVLLLGAVGIALAAPVLGVLVSRIAAGGVLLVVVVVLLATIVVRRRHSPDRIWRTTGRTPTLAGTDPEPNRV